MNPISQTPHIYTDNGAVILALTAERDRLKEELETVSKLARTYRTERDTFKKRLEQSEHQCEAYRQETHRWGEASRLDKKTELAKDAEIASLKLVATENAVLATERLTELDVERRNGEGYKLEIKRQHDAYYVLAEMLKTVKEERQVKTATIFSLQEQLTAKDAELREMREALEKLNGFDRRDMGHQQYCDYVNEVASEALSRANGGKTASEK